MRKNYFHADCNRESAEDGADLVKKFLWVAVIVFALLVMQDRLNADAEKLQQEQSRIRAASCN